MNTSGQPKLIKGQLKLNTLGQQKLVKGQLGTANTEHPESTKLNTLQQLSVLIHLTQNTLWQLIWTSLAIPSNTLKWVFWDGSKWALWDSWDSASKYQAFGFFLFLFFLFSFIYLFLFLFLVLSREKQGLSKTFSFARYTSEGSRQPTEPARCKADCGQNRYKAEHTRHKQAERSGEAKTNAAQQVMTGGSKNGNLPSFFQIYWHLHQLQVCQQRKTALHDWVCFDATPMMLQTTGKIKQQTKWGKMGRSKKKLGKHGTQNLSLKMCLKQSQCCAKSKHKEFVHTEA